MVVQEREGGDITAADMVLPPSTPSDIQEFFSGSTVFITGATGYLGKLILEKLLRVCPGIKKIYVLVREKKGKDNRKRFEEIFDCPVFDPLKRKSQHYADKVELIPGDCALPELGLTESDKEKLIAEVDNVFHCAATVRFDEPLKIASYINVRAVRDLLAMSKQMRKLRSFVHISTAYSNCIRKDIDELIYQPKISGDKLLTLIETVNEDTLDQITPTLLGEYPNTYVFTKCIAEEMIQSRSRGLPIAIVRPSIVIATVKEPVAGWIDNFYGATGFLIGAALGVIRTMHGNPEARADVVPADFVINCAIAAAWNVATMKSISPNKEATKWEKPEKDVLVYNYVSGTQNPMSWRTYISLATKHALAVPSPHVLWHSIFKMRKSYTWNLFCLYLLHYLPAYVIDFVAMCIGKKPMMVEANKKIDKFSTVISYFALREWDFCNRNTQGLYNRLNPTDRELFEFDISSIDWDAYYYTYLRGCRLYLLKDPMETIPQGEAKLRKVMIGHYALVTVLLLLVYQLLAYMFRALFL